MPTYVALLRGINVGGHNRMKMDELRAVCGSIGLSDVRTYIQSGNVIFEASGTDEAALRSDLHDAIEDEFGYDVTVMARTLEEFEAVVANAPFDEPAGDGIKRYVTFLNGVPGEEQAEALDDARSDAEAYVLRGREVYSELDKDALGDGRFTDVSSVLGTDGTRRNWNVVTSVLELASS